jgi:hypothetical protein
MATLESILRGRLTNLHKIPDGWQARCPACAAGGADKTGNHLRIYHNGAYSCVVHQGDSAHNKAIRAFIYTGATPEILASLESCVVEEDVKLDVDKVYPESALAQLVPDHTYWINRGISVAVLEKLEGGLSPEGKSKMSGRYLFPIRDHVNGRIIGWTGRLTQPNSFGPKWKHLVRTSRCVYPLTVSRESILKTRKVVLYESQGDYMAAATCGMYNGLILLGLNLNSKVLGFLASAGLNEIIISTNNDTLGKEASKEAGNKAAEKLKEKLALYFGENKIRIRLPQTRKDWGDVLKDGTGELEIFKKELEVGETSITT